MCCSTLYCATAPVCGTASGVTSASPTKRERACRRPHFSDCPEKCAKDAPKELCPFGIPGLANSLRLEHSSPKDEGKCDGHISLSCVHWAVCPYADTATNENFARPFLILSRVSVFESVLIKYMKQLQQVGTDLNLLPLIFSKYETKSKTVNNAVIFGLIGLFFATLGVAGGGRKRGT